MEKQLVLFRGLGSTTMATLSDILDEDLLCDLAGEVYFERGVRYFEQDRVRSLAQYDEHITAEVMGTETYQVHLWLQDHELLSRCSCPLGVDELFCKHCVAVGLAWIDEPPPTVRPKTSPPKSAPPLKTCGNTWPYRSETSWCR